MKIIKTKKGFTQFLIGLLIIFIVIVIIILAIRFARTIPIPSLGG